jgi:peptidoglycan/LPS O-acetylase OafA/YrhL
MGVDIFFVISGFVITSHLLERREQTVLQLVSEFSVRRFWRLFPVVLVGVLVTLAMSLVVLSPFGEQEPVIRTGWWSIAFLGNIELMLNTNYWGGTYNPLLHMWSLGVEGQLYLGMLLLVVALMLFGRHTAQSKRDGYPRWLPNIIFIAICASFSLSLASSYDVSFIPIARQFAFYGSPTRAWEFLFGALLALQQVRLEKLSWRSASQLRIVGWIGILIGIVVAKPASVFPGWIALFPVLGTTAIIAAGGAVRNFSRLLNLRIFQHLGNISYSWYVVHFPVITFLVILFPNNSILERITFVGLSYLLSLAMFYGVEKPLRPLSFAKKRRQLSVGLLMITSTLLVILLIGQLSATLRTSWQPRPFYTGFRDEVELLGECLDSPVPDDISENCVWNRGVGTPRLMLLGDSQAASLASGAINASVLVGAEIAIHAQGGCPFISSTLKISRCPSWDSRLNAIRDYQPDVLIIANAWSQYDDSQIDILAETLQNEQLPTILVLEAPYLGVSRDSLASKFLFHLSPVPSDPAIHDVSLDVLNRVAGTSKVAKIFNPETALCPETRCSFEVDFLRGAFWDGNHLSRKGSDLLAPRLAEIISTMVNN